MPAIPGLKTFGGTWFHSARWNHDLDLVGRRIAVIGNAASAIQFIPRIAPAAERVTVFQRTANWILPRNDRVYTALEKWIFRHVPFALRLYRHLIYLAREATFFGFFKDSWLGRQIEKRARRYMRSHIADPRLRAILTPDHPAGCKRILISDDYYQALQRPNVEVVTVPINSIAREGVVTADGTLHRADTLVFATGFQASSFLAPMRIEGADGRTLEEAWQGGADAYLGVAVAGFPNLFLLYGPNTNLGHSSIIFMVECQVNYVLRCVRELARAGLRWLDVRPEAMIRFNATLQREMQKTVWAGGCASWYRTSAGKIISNWPGFTIDYWWRTRRPDFAHFARHA
jgi:cation diffusion facilitator CzcD-associated flavoprotein CzcO